MYKTGKKISLRAFSELSFVFLILLFAVSSIKSERLPLRTYTSADGLASSVIHHAFRDSQGFLWFSARGGVSRFDGYEFTSYLLDDEQSAPLVHFFLESHNGKYFWIATDGGLYRVERHEVAEIKPASETLRKGVRRLNASKVSNQPFWTLFEDKEGNLLGGADSGMYLIKNDADQQIILEEIVYSNSAKKENRMGVRNFAESKDGSLWSASDAGLLRRLPDGRWLTYEIPRVISIGNEAYSVLIDSKERVWITFRSGLFILYPESIESLANLPNLTARLLPLKEQKTEISGSIELPSKSGEMIRLSFADADNKQSRAGQAVIPFVEDIFQSTDDKIWIPTQKSLYLFEGNNYKRLQDTDALPGTTRRIVEDIQGNLWFGTFSGLVKYTQSGLTTYNQRNELPEPNIHLIQETPDGDLLVVHGTWRVSRLTNEGFETRQLNLLDNARYTWTAFPIVQDKTGTLWSLQTAGLYRFNKRTSLSATVNQTPQHISNNIEILKDKLLYRAFNDGQGNIWFSGIDSDQINNMLAKFNPQTGEWQNYSDKEGFPKGRRFASFAEDRSGNLWFGFYGSEGIVKFANDRFTEIKTSDGLPKGVVLALHIDQKGRLWISSNESGVTRVDNPSAEKLEFVRYTAKEGLTSDNVRCLAEDNDGNIYAGTVSGVSQINPETGKIKQITTADGLAADFVQTAFRDKHGVMWFGTSNGLSKLEPVKESVPSVPSIFISDLQIAGVNYAVSEFGQTEIGGIDVSASQNNLQINFFSLGEPDSVRYQYKLEGSESDWSLPGEQRSVNFANLSSGSYRFLVRAVNSAGVVSEKNAVVTFKINPPFWKSWWFLALALFFIGGAIFSLDRYRVAKTRQVQAALTKSKESEIRFRTLADTASDTILTIDEESKIIFVNQAIEKVFGYTPEEIIGQNLTILMPKQMRHGHQTGLNRYLKTNTKNINWMGVALLGLHKSGEEIPLEVSFGEFERDGKRYFTGIARDISERKRAEEELQKAREERFKELERVRTRIATDLHDDIGSSLTQIAVLSEVARGQANYLQAENLASPLERIKGVSKELVAVMSDIVWAINPQKDFLHDLVQRMRRFASDVFTGRGIKFEFIAPGIENNLQLGANIRREIFAIFKESVNNAVKYSECTEAKAIFLVEENLLLLKIEDNGKGFDVNKILSEDFKPEIGGNGLVNMRRRAQELGGTCEISSEIGKGTVVSLVVTLQANQNIPEKV